MLSVTAEVILDEDKLEKLDAAGIEYEDFIKQSLSMRLGEQIANSELGLQKYARVGQLKWTQTLWIMDDEELDMLKGVNK